MQRHLSAALLLALAGGTCSATHAATAAPSARVATPRDIGVDFPQYADAAALKTACDQGLAATQRDLARIEKRPTDKGWLAAYDAFAAAMEDRANPITFVSAVHPDKAIREASEACELRWNDFFSTLGQNEKIYRVVRSLKGADETDRQLLKKLREDFEDAGVGLPPDQRQRAKALSDKVAELGQSFDRNIRDANVKLPFTEAELAGVPEGVWKNAKRDEQGRVLLGLSYPEYLPVMQTADSGAARERMWRAKQNEGGEANLKLLDEIVKLRKEYAGLFGASSWDEFQIRRRMAESPQRVQAFLAEVKGAVEARERSEVEELRRAKAEQLGQPLEATRFERWDLSYYTERLRKAKYSVDQEAFRQYFPPQESLQFTLRLIEKLMGVRYQRVAGAKAWHPEVQTYAVSDASSGKPLGLLRVDLYPRDGKYNHAAVWPVRGASTQLKRSTQAHLVVNFDRKGLTIDELETLLHELGHSVHTNLSATRWVQQAGTNVLRDFVEAPSQMLEDWVFDLRTQKLFAEVCPACTPVPEALLKKVHEAKDYGKGVQYSRQHLYASYDLALYGPEPRDAMALWAQMEGATPLGHVKGTMFPAGFSHIATNYSAGYYGYLWSLVVAEDMRTAFAKDKLDARVGMRYRQTVLANGSSRPPQQLVRDFLGRDFNANAFFEELKK